LRIRMAKSKSAPDMITPTTRGPLRLAAKLRALTRGSTANGHEWRWSH